MRKKFVDSRAAACYSIRNRKAPARTGVRRDVMRSERQCNSRHLSTVSAVAWAWYYYRFVFTRRARASSS